MRDIGWEKPVDAREEAATLIRDATAIGIKADWLPLMISALHYHLSAVDEDLQKLRKELRTLNGEPS